MNKNIIIKGFSGWVWFTCGSLEASLLVFVTERNVIGDWIVYVLAYESHY